MLDMSNDEILNVEVKDGKIFVDGVELERMPESTLTPEEAERLNASGMATTSSVPDLKPVEPKDEATRLKVIEGWYMFEQRFAAKDYIQRAVKTYEDIRITRNLLKGYGLEQATEIATKQTMRSGGVASKMNVYIDECTARDYESLISWWQERERKNREILTPRLNKLQAQLEQKRERHERPKGPQPR